MNTNLQPDIRRNVFDIVDSRLRNKLLVAFVIVLIVPVVIMELARRRDARNVLIRQATAEREGVRDLHAQRLQKVFETATRQARNFSNSSVVLDAMKQLPNAFVSARSQNAVSKHDGEKIRRALNGFYERRFTPFYEKRSGRKAPRLQTLLANLDEDSLYLQYLYLQNNPHPLHSNERFDGAEDNSTYSELHAKYHPAIRQFLQNRGFDNLYLCEAGTGRVVYSVRKTLDLGISTLNDSRDASNLGQALQAAAAMPSDELFVSTFAPNVTSYGDVSAFIVSPVFDGNHRLGYAVFQISIEQINRVFQESNGYYRTAETYLVGPDRLFRSNSRFTQQLQVSRSILNPTAVVDTGAVNEALSGQTSSGIVSNYLDNQTISAWRPVELPGTAAGRPTPITWVAISEVGLDEVIAPANTATFATTLAIVVALCLVLAWGAAFFLSRTWMAQVESIQHTLARVENGDANARAEVISQDEFGDVAEGLNRWLNRGGHQDETIGMTPARLEARSELRAFSLTTVGDTDELRHVILNVQDNTHQVSRFAQQIQLATESLSEESATQSSQIVDTARAIDEMVESIHQVAESTTESASVAKEARKTATNGSQAVLNTIRGMDRIRSQVQSTSKRIKRLGESSQEIGEIVQLISDVADRTSILALNASVQAAMAGDAGHGFEVVAEEVDRLAKRCNDATKHIARLVKCIQTETSEAIVAMEESTLEVVEGSNLASQAGESLAGIDAVSKQLAELIDSISFAAKQQARSGLLVSRSIKEVSSVIHNTATGTKQAAQMVKQLTVHADQLRSSISKLVAPGSTATAIDSQDPPESNTAASAPTRGAGIVMSDDGGDVPIAQANSVS